MNQADVTIRQATDHDIDRMALIDRVSHAQWNTDQFRDEMHLEFSRTWVAESSSGIEGFIVVRFIQNEAEILNIAIDPSMRERGIGRALVLHAVNSLCRGDLKVFLEVREKNSGALGFYRSMGFEKIHVRINYYTDDNAVIMGALFHEDK